MKNVHLGRQDAVRWLSKMPDESVDLFVTDPPYESLEKHRRRGTTTRLKRSKASSNPWFGIFPNDRFPELFDELYRVLKPDRHAYLFCDQETMFVLKPVVEAVGFRFVKPLVWDKMRMGLGYHYRAQYELILFLQKGKRRLNSNSVRDILRYQSIRNGYPTEKPARLIEVLVEQSAQPGEVVCDPFMGSCPVGVAALHHGCTFLGTDTSPDAQKLARQRLNAITT